MEPPFTIAKPSAAMDVLFSLTIAAMFCGINTRVGPAKLQLSDVLAIVTVFLAFLRGFATPRLSPGVFILFLIFVTIYCASATGLGADNAVKELVQFCLLFTFLFSAFGYYRTRPTERLLVLVTIFTVGVLAYNIGWHIHEGYYVGWKRLNEPKTVFIVLPMLLALIYFRFVAVNRRHRMLFTLAVVVTAAIVLLSGERKAYIFAAVAFLVCARFTALLRYALPVALGLGLLWSSASLDKTGYLQRQFDSLESVVSETAPDKEKVSLSNLIDARRPVTLSDAQREISKRLARSMWEQAPLLGIGTNAFYEAIRQQASLPKEFQMNIHGEFQRTLFENGIIGLSVYVAIWAVAIVQILLAWSQARDPEARRLNQLKLCAAMMFLIYCSFEASKGLTILSVCAVAFIAGLQVRASRAAIQPRAERRTESAQIEVA